MGFRSTLISEHYSATLPAWFQEKYKDKITVFDGTLIASKTEFKIFDNQIFEDFQTALIESGFFKEVSEDFSVVVAVLAEDKSISKVEIRNSSINYFWMDIMSEEEHVWMQG